MRASPSTSSGSKTSQPPRNSLANIWRSWALACVILLFCSSAKAEIAVTLPPLAGLVKLLLPESDVSCLLPANADPHHFSLTPRRIERLRQVKLLVRATADDGAWRGLPGDIKAVNLWPDKGHAWLLPIDVQQILPRLAEALTKVYPARAQAISTALEKALAETAAMERELQSALDPLRERGVIMQHPSWQAFCRHFGIEVLSVLDSHSHGHESGPRHLQNALAQLQARPGAMLWGDDRDNVQPLYWLANHAQDVPIQLLDPLGDCGMPWSRLMRQNLERILVPANTNPDQSAAVQDAANHGVRSTS
jgi:zinc transport system substrate-binding protein